MARLELLGLREPANLHRRVGVHQVALQNLNGLRGHLQRRLLIFVHVLNERALLQQELDNQWVPEFGGYVQRRVLELVGLITISLRFAKRLAFTTQDSHKVQVAVATRTPNF